MTPALELSELRAGYGPLEVLHGVDLSVGPGEVVALLGPNGSGKSTTIAVCAGLLTPTAGEVRVAGVTVNDRERSVRADRLAKAGVCTIPEGRGVFPNLSVEENLVLAAGTGGDVDSVRDRAYDTFPRLSERRGQLAGTMSGGEQQMLAMARALATDPAVLLLDELSMGLAPLIVEQLYESVGAVAASGVSMLIVEQFARHVLGICDRAAIMLHGAIERVGEPEVIEGELSSAYLGA